MKLRPTIFLSGVSSEFGSFRDAVEVEIQKKGYFAENQSSFGVDYRKVEEMLRWKLQDADAVIHVVGFHFGAEPKDRPPNKPRRSYTQIEFDIAREMNKPVYIFLSGDPNVRDAASADEKPEDQEAEKLQLAHRNAIASANELFYHFKDKTELCQLVATIPTIPKVDFGSDISRIIRYAPADLLGREVELKLLNDAWLKVRRAESPRPHIITFVALGGEGKTSLVSKWAAEQAHHGWPGCDAAFAWSFYSQGTREQHAASSDLFLKEAINFFGDDADKQFAASAAGPYEKGQRLARIVGQRRSLLILDGLEPLQYAPTSPTAGELKDAGVAALLKGLAADNNGLCVITTRYAVPDLKAFWQTTGPEEKLFRLSSGAGVHLLKTLGVNGTADELQMLVEDVKGHALTLNLLGTYLRDAHGGDIRRRDRVKLEEADAEEQGGHAFRVIEAYERAFESQGDKGNRALAILRLLGLFDRPASADCLAALLEEPPIRGLTDPLVELNEAQRNLAFKRLEDAKLLTANRDASSALISLDAHPLLREYFARQLRTQQPETWRAAHRRLYEHLCATTKDKERPTLEDLQPLYQAVAHGCQAGLAQQACGEVYIARISRRESYSMKKLGASASDLGVLAYFFENPWNRVSLGMTEYYQAWALNMAFYNLRAVGRLTEALEPVRLALDMSIMQRHWDDAARTATNLSELELTLGKVTESWEVAHQSVIYADRSGNAGMRTVAGTTYADGLHQAGRRAEAETRFREAEQIQKEWQPYYRFLYSLQGFRYCDLLLAVSERAAWQRTLECGELSLLVGYDFSKSKANAKFAEPQEGDDKSPSKAIHAVLQRVKQTLKWAEGSADASVLTMALEHLTLGHATLYEEVLSKIGSIPNIGQTKLKSILDDAVNGLRRAGDMTRLPLGLLARAWLRFRTGPHIAPGSAQEDLDEAWEIAERGPMRLHMGDIHLYRARLFFREEKYPWESPRKDLEEAERLINECGYHRRDEELADAKRVILSQSV